MLKRMKLFLTGTVIIVMSMVLAACNGEWYIKSNGVELDSGIFLYYAIQAYDEAYLLADNDDDDFWNQEVEGKDIKEWVEEKALELCQFHFVIEGQFAENGLELDGEDQENIENLVYDKYWLSGLRESYGPLGIDEECFEELMAVEVKKEKLLDYYNDELSKQISEQDINTWFSENYISFAFISVPKYIYGEQISEEEIEIIDMEEIYKEIESDIQSGTPLFEKIEELMGMEEPDISLSASAIEESSRLDIAIKKTSASFPKEFRDMIENGDVGETIYYNDEINATYNIAMKTELLEDDEQLNYHMDEIMRNLISEKYDELLNSLAEEYDFKYNKAVIRKTDFEELF